MVLVNRAFPSVITPQAKKLTRKESSGWHMFCVTPIKSLFEDRTSPPRSCIALLSLRGCSTEDLLRRERFANQVDNFPKSSVSALGKDAPSHRRAPSFFRCSCRPKTILQCAKKTARQPGLPSPKQKMPASTSVDL